MQKYSSWEEYFNVQPTRGKEMLLQLKTIFEKTLPNAKESWGYGVPAYDLVPNAKIDKKIMIAGFKNHISFYPRKETIKYFMDDLKDYLVLKGTIQIKHSQDLPSKLIEKMIKHTYELVKEE